MKLGFPSSGARELNRVSSRRKYRRIKRVYVIFIRERSRVRCAVVTDLKRPVAIKAQTVRGADMERYSQVRRG